MKHLFLPKELALLAKEKGFNEPCLGAHAEWGFMSCNDVNSLSDEITQEDLNNQNYLEEDNVCLAPLYQQIIDWLFKKIEEKEGFSPSIEVFNDGSGSWRISPEPDYDYSGKYIEFSNLNEAIKKAFELI